MNIETLAQEYLTDPDSGFHTLRHATKVNYQRLIVRIIADIGERDLASLTSREIKHAHAAWTGDGKVTMAHGLVTQLRILIGFGSAVLEDPDCLRIRSVLSGQKFPNARRRNEWLTPAQADSIRDLANQHKLHAIALAQAIQQDCALRQKDVIGERVPMDDPAPGIPVDGGMKWLRGITAEEIDPDLALRHKASKRGQVLTFPLDKCPSVMEEWLWAPKAGPLIIDPDTSLPYHPWKFRRRWRWLANKAGVPKNIWNMDSRAGRITTILAAGIPIEDARKFAGHEQQSTTSRYSRGAEDAINRVLTASTLH